MKGITKKYAVLLLMISWFAACKPDPDFNAAVVSPEPQIQFHVPDGWPAPVYNFENNTLTDAGFYLGRRLFYDTRFSRDNTISCGSCHQSYAAFSHAGHALSHGVDDLLGVRNSPALFNLNWHKGFFWDGGVNHIEVQPLSPIQNPVEMDENLPNIIEKLKADAKYKEMFKAAWGDETITSQRIFKSLAQFMGMLVSDNSKYDQYKRGETGLTASETKGYAIYRDKCAACHTEPLFSDYSYRNNGLVPTSDSGRMRITVDEADKYKFKVPSLRNLKYTGPYMYDGRIKTLEGVLDHYDTGIYQFPTLDPLLKDGIHLTTEERSNLLDFLNTLNDETFIRNPMFQEVTE